LLKVFQKLLLTESIVFVSFQIVLQIRSVRNLSFYARRNWLVDGSSYK